MGGDPRCAIARADLGTPFGAGRILVVSVGQGGEGAAGFLVEEVDEVGPVGFLGHGFVGEVGGQEALPGLIYSTLHYLQVNVE